MRVIGKNRFWRLEQKIDDSGFNSRPGNTYRPNRSDVVSPDLTLIVRRVLRLRNLAIVVDQFDKT